MLSVMINLKNQTCSPFQLFRSGILLETQATQNNMTFPNNLRRSLRIITEINFRDNQDQSQKLEIRTRFKLLLLMKQIIFLNAKVFILYVLFLRELRNATLSLMKLYEYTIA
jgi:hypothetical protein